ncbi:unnamed protein product [Lactuca virosa]|uniref:Ionotropic glutamate receptor C-terminal domain-containing protein n=1 Tax=Lactuca virosa TaxID=75947 RepID=A0AAU9N4N7_9ASTR|nr:unnamed protein product [Lactuca virosa]
MDVEHDVKKNVTTATWFSIDVFNTCIRALPYEEPYTFILFENCTYDDLVQKVYNEEIDAVVCDSTILANRSKYVDFTATYTDLSVGTLARIKKKNIWFFLRPLMDIYLWLVAIGSLIFNVFIVWAIERMNPDSNGSTTQQNGKLLSGWTFLLIILFAQKDELSRNLSKFVMFIWFIVVLILFTGYDAFLTSQLTHSPYYSYQDYAHALSDDSGADAIVDEIPYIKMFLSRYSGDCGLVSSLPITSGFCLCSPLVEDVSREIAKIRLDGTLGSLENKWYENRISLPSRNSTIPHAVTLDKFGGLFIISAATSTLTFMVSLVHLIRIRLRQFQRIINHFR